jgi:hypothetical protein
MRSLVHRLSLLPAADPFRSQKESEMLNKLYDMGILGEDHHLVIRDGPGKVADSINRLERESVRYRKQVDGILDRPSEIGCRNHQAQDGRDCF